MRILSAFRSSHRQDARSRAEIEHAARSAPFEDCVERQEAASGRPVMAGAKRQCSFDFERQIVGFDGGAIMRAVDEKATGPDRNQPGQRSRDPVLLRDLFVVTTPLPPRARPPEQDVSDVGFVDVASEIDLDQPGLRIEGSSPRPRTQRPRCRRDRRTRPRCRMRLWLEPRRR